MKNFTILFGIFFMVIGMAMVSCSDDDSDSSTDIGQTGLDRNRLLDSLDDSERLQYCEWQVDVLSNGECSGDSGEAVPYSPVSATDCAASDINFPECSVGLREDCYLSLSEDICPDTWPATCQEYLDCFNSMEPPPNSAILKCDDPMEVCCGWPADSVPDACKDF